MKKLEKEGWFKKINGDINYNEEEKEVLVRFNSDDILRYYIYKEEDRYKYGHTVLSELPNPENGKIHIQYLKLKTLPQKTEGPDAPQKINKNFIAANAKEIPISAIVFLVAFGFLAFLPLNLSNIITLGILPIAIFAGIKLIINLY